MTNNIRQLAQGQAIELADISRDDEGYLLDPDDWSPQIMQSLASEMDIELSDEHIQIIQFIRQRFEENQSVPQARSVLKHMAELWGTDKATRKHLYQLFPYGYGQQACKIAGMRKPLKLMLDV